MCTHVQSVKDDLEALLRQQRHELHAFINIAHELESKVIPGEFLLVAQLANLALMQAGAVTGTLTEVKQLNLAHLV